MTIKNRQKALSSWFASKVTCSQDIFHEQVKRALEKEGWTITHDPLPIAAGSVEMSIDLGAEKLIAAEKEGKKIAVEIKSFLGKSTIYTISKK